MLYLIFRAEPETRVAFGGSDAEKGQTMRAAVRHQLDPTIRSNDTRDFHASLRAKIVGQEEGIQSLVDMYQVFCAGLNSPGRPVGNLLFLGPTGSGSCCWSCWTRRRLPWATTAASTFPRRSFS